MCIVHCLSHKPIALLFLSPNCLFERVADLWWEIEIGVKVIDTRSIALNRWRRGTALNRVTKICKSEILASLCIFSHALHLFPILFLSLSLSLNMSTIKPTKVCHIKLQALIIEHLLFSSLHFIIIIITFSSHS